jgi:hypothetical protein
LAVLALALVLLAAGCATVPPTGPPAAVVPDLRGTWTGTWGGTPVTLVVLEQELGHGDSGLVLGAWQVLGERYPTARGVLTSTIDGVAVSTHMNGLLSDSGAGVVLTVHARASAGEQWLRLRLVAPDRLEGMGQSQMRWGPQGPAQLRRAGRHRSASRRGGRGRSARGRPAARWRRSADGRAGCG